MSGKELFNYNSSLFVDDESAFDTTNDATIGDEMKALARLEDERILEDTNKAQAEQMRLFELQRIESEARRERELLKRERALASGRNMFLFNGIFVNQIVFEEEDEEDLDLFTDLPFPFPRERYDVHMENVSA